jgi:hypothetical protein
MSLLSATTPYRRQADSVRVPVVLPLVEVHIQEDGHLDVYVDHDLHETSAPLTRDDLPSVLGEITSRLAAPVRVEVHEADGNVFTDIALPNSVKRARPAAAEPTRFELSPGEIGGVGFAPDEEVAVAVVVAHQAAGPDGSARLRLPPALLADRPGLVVLLGRTSGTIATSVGCREPAR